MFKIDMLKRKILELEKMNGFDFSTRDGSTGGVSFAPWIFAKYDWILLRVS